MGGYNSGGRNQRYITVEACAKVDIAMLRRAGLIRPDAAKRGQLTFYRREKITTVLTILATPEASSLQFSLAVSKQGQHDQIVPLSFTPCNYGHDRPWMHCPLCRRRVFRLYYYDNTWNGSTQVHFFACRHCRHLTYNLRRERGLSKHQSQTAKASDKLKHWAALHGDTDYIKALKGLGWSELPPKPRWMRWNTYDRIATKFEDASDASEDVFYALALAYLGETP